MNKKFFKFFMMAVALVTMVSFTSCGDDEPDDNGSIVGEWRLTHEKIRTLENGEEISSWEEDMKDRDCIIVFKSDGTYSRTYGGEPSDQGTYEVNGNKITVVFNNHHPFPGTFSINGNKMVMTLVESWTDNGITSETYRESTYERVK